jgi:hypothetical protein
MRGFCTGVLLCLLMGIEGNAACRAVTRAPPTDCVPHIFYAPLLISQAATDAFGSTPTMSRVVPSCALVGSAAALLDTRSGPEINAHDLVARLNDAPVRGYEDHVGARTDVRVQNCFAAGFREGNETLILACDWKHLAGADKLAPTFLSYARSVRKKEWGKLLTTGFISILLMAHACSSVTLYGFAPRESVVRQGRDALFNWYYDHRAFVEGRGSAEGAALHERHVYSGAQRRAPPPVHVSRTPRKEEMHG